MKATIMQRLLTLRETHIMAPEDATFMNWAETYMLSMHSSDAHSGFKFG